MNNTVTKLEIQSDALGKKADWLAKRDTLLEQVVKVTTVENDNQLELSGNLQRDISKHVKELGRDRLDLTRQIDTVKKSIMDQEKAMVKGLSEQLRRLSYLNSGYATRVAAAAEAERQRIEAERRAAADRIFEAEQARQAEASNAFGEDVTFVEKGWAPEPEPVEPLPPSKPRTSGVSFVENWQFRITDSAKIPREYLMVDESKIRKIVKALKAGTSIPGVEVFKTMDTRSK